MSRFRLALAATALLASGASHADSCDAIKAQIDASIRSGGLVNFALDAVDVAASAPGRVVGNCAMGAKKIVMTGGVGSGAAAAAHGATTVPATPGAANVSVRTGSHAAASARTVIKPAENILTECKDGSMSIGATCRK